VTQEQTQQPVEPMLQFFSFEHLPEHLKVVSCKFYELAHSIVALLPRNPERTVALRKLLEAKDCAVRAVLFKSRDMSRPDCLCYRGHAENCPRFDARQALKNLQGDIEALAELLAENFNATMGYNGECYFIALKHSSQDEQFTGETLMEALQEFAGWFSECQAMA
jgi:hypothetical protein